MMEVFDNYANILDSRIINFISGERARHSLREKKMF